MFTEVLINVFPEVFQFCWGEVIYGAEWRSSTFLQGNGVVIGAVLWQFIRLLFAEDFSEFVILRWDFGEVWVAFLGGSGGDLRDVESVKLYIWHFEAVVEGNSIYEGYFGRPFGARCRWRRSHGGVLSSV